MATTLVLPQQLSNARLGSWRLLIELQLLSGLAPLLIFPSSFQGSLRSEI